MQDKDLRPVQDEPKKDESKSIQGSKKQNTRVFLWVICALYLLYLVSKLVKDLFGGQVTTTSTKIMVIVSSVLFSAVAVYLLVISIRHAVRSFKASISAMAEADEEERAAEEAKKRAAERDDDLDLPDAEDDDADGALLPDEPSDEEV